MNTLLLLVALSSIIGISSAVWFPGVPSSGGSTSNIKRDCKWVAWTTDGKCKKTGPNQYQILRKREQIPAKHGGAPCVGPSTSYLPCNERQYVATTFLETVNAQTRAGTANRGAPSRGGGGQKRVITTQSVKPPVLNPCTKPHVNADGKLRMFGKPCETRKRRRRSAEGLIETYEEPLRESIKTRTKRQVLSTNNRDILFLLDESGSVNAHNFKKEVRMAKALTNKFCGAIRVGRLRTRVGIMSFDKKQHHHLDFDQLFEKSEVLDHMDTSVSYNKGTSGRTCLYDALEHARTKMFIPTRGARVEEIYKGTTEQVVVLFTDGCANCKNQGDLPTILKSLRVKFEQMGIPFIVFFIGEVERCEKIMEGLLDGSRCYQVFRAMDWAEFDKMILDIEAIPCMDAWMIGPSCPTV